MVFKFVDVRILWCSNSLMLTLFDARILWFNKLNHKIRASKHVKKLHHWRLGLLSKHHKFILTIIFSMLIGSSTCLPYIFHHKFLSFFPFLCYFMEFDHICCIFLIFFFFLMFDFRSLFSHWFSIDSFAKSFPWGLTKYENLYSTISLRYRKSHSDFNSYSYFHNQTHLFFLNSDLLKTP